MNSSGLFNVVSNALISREKLMLSLAERSSHLHMLSMHTVTLLSWRKGDTGMLISEGGMRTLNCYWCFSNRCCPLILGLVKKRCRGSFFFPPIEHEQIPVSDDRSANLCKLRQWPPLITAISIVSELLFTLLSFFFAHCYTNLLVYGERERMWYSSSRNECDACVFSFRACIPSVSCK